MKSQLYSSHMCSFCGYRGKGMALRRQKPRARSTKFAMAAQVTIIWCCFLGGSHGQYK